MVRFEYLQVVTTTIFPADDVESNKHAWSVMEESVAEVEEASFFANCSCNIV